MINIVENLKFFLFQPITTPETMRNIGFQGECGKWAGKMTRHFSSLLTGLSRKGYHRIRAEILNRMIYCTRNISEISDKQLRTRKPHKKWRIDCNFIQYTRYIRGIYCKYIRVYTILIHRYIRAYKNIHIFLFLWKCVHLKIFIKTFAKEILFLYFYTETKFCNFLRYTLAYIFFK